MPDNPTPTTDPYAVAVLSPKLIGEIMLQVGFPKDQLVTGISVALAESGGRRKATHKNSNGSTDYGLWQINSIHAKEFPGLIGQWDNAIANATMAKGVYDGAGWKAWSAYNNEAYKKHVSAATKAATGVVGGRADELGLHEINPAEVVGGVADKLGVGGFIGGILSWLAKAGIVAGVFVLGLLIVVLGVWAIISQTKAGKVAVKAATKGVL